MRAWLTVWRGVAALDAVARLWAKNAQVPPNQVAVVLLLAEAARGPTEIAAALGMTRQRAYEVLEALRKNRDIVAASVSARGRVRRWTLTHQGRELARLLETWVNVWEAMVGAHVDLQTLSGLMEQLTGRLLDRPGGAGWKRALLVPPELTPRRYRPMTVDEVHSLIHAEQAELAQAPQLLHRAGGPASWSSGDWKMLREQWRKLWDPDAR